MMIRIASALLLSACVLSPVSGLAQGIAPGNQPDLPIDPTPSREVVEGIVKHLGEAYVFPETAKKIEADLRGRLERNEYANIKSARKLAEVLTEHLQAVSKDKHLRVFYSYDPILGAPRNPGPDRNRGDRDELRERLRALGEAMNFGFEKVERLEGNVGYLDLRAFMPAELGGDTAAAAMNLRAHTDALIIDVRKNGGGDPRMVALVSSYLFGPEPVHLNDLYIRPEDSTHQWWTLPHVPGRRYEGKPVYVLTSRRTFSAAEEFTYNLKSLKRATIVGETTGCGAHPGGMRRITEHFGMFVPSGRAINPITWTNWEGTGITPDVPVAADRALATAHLAALRTIVKDLRERQKGPGKVDPMRLEQARAAVDRLEKELAGPEKTPESRAAKPAK